MIGKSGFVSLLAQTLNVSQTGGATGARTCHAVVADEQVGLEVLGTRIGAVEHRVRDADAARASAGADDVHVRDDVGEAADVAVVAQDATTEPHAPVQRPPHDDHRRRGTRRSERLRFAVLALH